MYQHVKRPRAFRFIRLRFPELMGLYRFFYADPPTIWFGGARVPIERDANGRVVLGNAASTSFLRSCEGGCQGDGGATLFCVGTYHEALCDLQVDYQNVDITCTADDSY